VEKKKFRENTRLIMNRKKKGEGPKHPPRHKKKKKKGKTEGSWPGRKRKSWGKLPKDVRMEPSDSRKSRVPRKATPEVEVNKPGSAPSQIKKLTVAIRLSPLRVRGREEPGGDPIEDSSGRDSRVSFPYTTVSRKIFSFLIPVGTT